METQWLVLNNAGIELESPPFYKLGASRMAGVQDRHIVLFRHGVDGVHQAKKVGLRINILLPMGGKKNVAFFFQFQRIQDF